MKISQFDGLATGANREKYTAKEYLFYGSFGFGIIGMFILYAFELEYFPRYTNISAFVTVALIVGLLSGIGLAYYNRKKAENATETMQIYVASIISCLIFAPLIFSLTNRAIALNEYEKEVQIVEIEKLYSSRFGIKKGEKPQANLLKVSYLSKGKTYSFSTKNLALKDSKRGESVQLNFKKGLLGFEYLLPN